MTAADRSNLVRLAAQVQSSRDRILASLGLTWAEASLRFLAPDPDSPPSRPPPACDVGAGYEPITVEPIRGPR